MAIVHVQMLSICDGNNHAVVELTKGAQIRQVNMDIATLRSAGRQNSYERGRIRHQLPLERELQHQLLHGSELGIHAPEWNADHAHEWRCDSASQLVTSDLGTFAANEYAKYVFQNGDISEAGTYSVRLTYTDASKLLKSDSTTFTVSA